MKFLPDFSAASAISRQQTTFSDIGFSQKQSVTILYALSALMGVAGIICTADRLASALILLAIVLVAGILNWRIFVGDEETREHTGLHMHAPKTDKKDEE